MWNCIDGLFRLGIGWDDDVEELSLETSSDISDNLNETFICDKCGFRRTSDDEWLTESEYTEHSSCYSSGDGPSSEEDISDNEWRTESEYTADSRPGSSANGPPSENENFFCTCECSYRFARCGSKGDHSDLSLHSFVSDVESMHSSQEIAVPQIPPQLSLQLAENIDVHLPELSNAEAELDQLFLEELQTYEDDLYIMRPRNLAAGGSSSLYKFVLGFGNLMFGTIPLVILLVITIKYIFFGIPPFNLDMGSSMLIREATKLLLFATILLQLGMETFLWNSISS